MSSIDSGVSFWSEVDSAGRGGSEASWRKCITEGGL